MIKAQVGAQKGHRFPQLDGWRGISISLVLAAHLLPLGPKALQLNATAAPAGMALFFTLSGFLIVTFLLRRPEVWPFLTRRCLRILPLSWLASAVLLLLFGASVREWISNFLFLLNYQTEYLREFNSHFWSLCVEMHFYLTVAMLVLLAGRRALWVLPLVGLGVTGLRIFNDVPISIVTHFRVDEILAGATMALLLPHKDHPALRPVLRISPWVWPLVLLVTASPLSGPLRFLRPYAGMMTVFSTLVRPEHLLSAFLGKSRILSYLARVSYALYVIHGPFRIGWFGEGSKFTLYLVKRPVTLACTFALAHLSTFYWESYFQNLGYKLTSKKKASTTA